MRRYRGCWCELCDAWSVCLDKERGKTQVQSVVFPECFSEGVSHFVYIFISHCDIMCLQARAVSQNLQGWLGKGKTQLLNGRKLISSRLYCPVLSCPPLYRISIYKAFDLPWKVCAAVEEERRRTHGITGSLCKSHTRAQLNSNGQLMHVKWRIYMDPTIQMWRPRAIEEWMDSRTLMFEGRRILTFAPWNWVRFPWWLVGSIVSTLVLSTAFYGKSMEMGEVRGWTTAVNDGHEISGNWSVILPLPRA